MPLKPLLLNLLNAAQTAQETLVEELSTTERDTIGTPQFWSARDQVAHMTFWWRDLRLTLAALASSQTPPNEEETQTRNERVFEAQREQPWTAILSDARQAHMELLAEVSHFTEDEMVRTGWFPPEGEGDSSSMNPTNQPLWAIILGNGFWHPLEHLTQFYLEHGDMARATQIQQAWANLVTQEALPPALQGIGLYTLALFYAKTQRAISAEDVLGQASALHPDPFIQSIVLSNLARLYAKEQKQREAKHALDRALTANPGLHLFFKQDLDLAPLLEQN